MCVLLAAPLPTTASTLVIQREADRSAEQVEVTAFLVRHGAQSEETLIPLGSASLASGQTAVTLSSRIPMDAGARVMAFGGGILAEGICREGPDARCFLETRAAGTLHLTLATKDIEGDASLPSLFVARSWQHGGGPAQPEHRVPCLQDGPGAWRCTVPIGIVDLRLDLPGFASGFVWGADVRRSQSAAEEITLAPSIHVRVGADAAQATGRLEPLGASKQLSRERLDFATKHAESSTGGLLDFDGVAPGMYQLVIESEGRAPFMETLRVEGGNRDLRLGTVHLDEVGELSVHVTPPVDSSGKRWHLVAAPLDAARSAPREQPMDLYGWATLSDVTSGRYLVLVRDSASSVWYSEKRELQAGDLLEIAIPRVEIEGTISIGPDPLMTTLVFGTTQGTEVIEVDSDEDGAFHGFLPHEGEWEVELGDPRLGCGTCGGDLGVVAIAPVDVEAGPSGKALLTIELPDTHLRGRVVRRDGTTREPVPGAQVLIIREPGDGGAGRRQGQLWADEEGAFVMQGFEPGSLSLGAIGPDGDGESAWRSVEVVEGVDPPDVELVVTARRDLVAKVMGPDGPVAGARLHAFPDGSLSESKVTGLDGGAILRVPDGSSGPLLVEVPAGEVIIASFALSQGSPKSMSLWADRSNGDLVLEGFGAVPSPAWLVSTGGAVPLNLLRNFAPSHVVTSQSRVTICGLAPGQYRLCVWSRSRCHAVDVLPGGQVELTRSQLTEAE